MGRNQRLALLGVAVAIAVIAAVVIGGGASGDDAVSGPQTIVVTGGKPDGGVKTLKYKKGDSVDLTVRSDTADEVHIHGYDLHQDVEQGGRVRFSFKAKIDGEFEVELEDAKQQLATLQVAP